MQRLNKRWLLGCILFTFILASLVVADTERQAAATQTEAGQCAANVLNIIESVRRRVSGTPSMYSNLPGPIVIRHLKHRLIQVVKQDLLTQHRGCPHNGTYTLALLADGYTVSNVINMAPLRCWNRILGKVL